MITTLGSPTAAPTEGTATPSPSRATTARAAASLRKADSEAFGGAVVARQPRRHARRPQSRDGPPAASPIGSGRTGTSSVTGGPVQSGVERRRTTRSASDGFDVSRPDSTGRPSGVASSTGQGTPTAGSSQAKPSSSDPSYSFVTR